MTTKAAPPPQATAWRNRITGSGEEAPDQLLAHPGNWRLHPRNQQAALAGALDTVGWVQQVMVNRRTGFVVDGHARVALAISGNEPFVPVLYVDLAPEEEPSSWRRSIRSAPWRRPTRRSSTNCSERWRSTVRAPGLLSWRVLPQKGALRSRPGKWKAISRRVRDASPSCSRCSATARMLVDHIVPLSQGGTEARANLRARSA